MRQLVTLAEPQDRAELLNIMESQSAQGDFSLLYTRRPDPYGSFMAENAHTHIGVIRTSANGRIAVQFVVSPKHYYINGEPLQIGYVNGVRKAPDYGGLLDWRSMSDFVKATNCDFYMCSFLQDNQSSRQLFTKQRNCFPALFPLCDYTTYIVNPQSIKKIPTRGVFRPMAERDEAKVLEFLEHECSRYQFAPVIKSIEDFYCLKKDDCYLLEYDNEILAFGALWDQGSYKQYIPIRYSGWIKMMSHFSKVLVYFGYIPIPPLNVPLRFPMLSLFFAKENNQRYYELFLSLIAQEIRKKYSMFLIGMAAGHPNEKFYRQLKSMQLHSTIYYVKYQRNIMFEQSRPIHLECGLL